MQINDIAKLPFDIRWKDISANCFDDGRMICGTSFDNEYCFRGTINEDSENPLIHITDIYKKTISCMDDFFEEIKMETQLNQLRGQAFVKLQRGTSETDLSRFNSDEISRIVKICNEDIGTSSEYSNVVSQIERDIKAGYKKFDALAMWLDQEGGLAKYEPILIRRIAVEVGGLKIKD